MKLDGASKKLDQVKGHPGYMRFRGAYWDKLGRDDKAKVSRERRTQADKLDLPALQIPKKR